MEAQNRESQMIEMSQWMTEVTQLLQSRLDADILAGDMPKEFEVSTQTMLYLINTISMNHGCYGFCSQISKWYRQVQGHCILILL